MSDPERQRKWMIPHRILHDVEFFVLSSLIVDWKVAIGLTAFFDLFVQKPLGKYIDDAYTKAGK